jgi:hypothetical protein
MIDFTGHTHTNCNPDNICLGCQAINFLREKLSDDDFKELLAFYSLVEVGFTTTKCDEKLFEDLPEWENAPERLKKIISYYNSDWRFGYGGFPPVRTLSDIADVGAKRWRGQPSVGKRGVEIIGEFLSQFGHTLKP